MTDWLKNLRELKRQSEIHPNEMARKVMREWYDLALANISEIFESMPQERQGNKASQKPGDDKKVG